MAATPVLGNTFFGLDVSGLSGGFASIRRRISRSTLLIELAPRMLQIAEARQRSHGLEIRHISRVPLPEGALERSVPTDPDAMAQLLHDLCHEKGIISHRAAVVVPPELAFQRLVQLPVGLSVKEARHYLLDPTNGITLPFPLAQTDFDLLPIEAFKPAVPESGLTTYQLTAIPVSLVDPVLSMLDLAGFDLQGLELGSLSSLRLIKDELLQLGAAGVSLLLDFLSDATLVNLVCAEGLIESERLPSIREFPRYELSELEREQILNRSQSLEEVIVENERYLPLSEMDLRSFSRDLEWVLTNYLKRFPGLTLNHAYVIGDGSAHPALAGLLQKNLNCPVKQVRPLLADGLRDWSLDEPLLQSSLNRLVGLGLGLLGVDQADRQSVPMSVEEVGSFVDTTLASGFLEAELDSQTNDAHLIKADALVGDVSQLVVAPDLLTEPVDVGASASGMEKDESEWPSLKLDVSEVVMEKEEKADDGVEIEAESVELSASGMEKDESEWPSLKLDVSETVMEEDENADDGVEIKAESVELSASGMEKDESEWPSLKLGGEMQESLTAQSDPNASLESNAIPGLSSAMSRQAQPEIIEERVDADALDSSSYSSDNQSPLGELRFKND